MVLYMLRDLPAVCVVKPHGFAWDVSKASDRLQVTNR